MFRFLPGRFTATNTAVIALIMYAYQVRGFQISGGPDWVRSEKFDIEAKEPDDLAEGLQKLPRDQRFEKGKSLLRSMLIDRFKMKLRRETRELPVFNLVVAKSGSKLIKAKPGVGVEWHNRQLQFSQGFVTAKGIDMVELARVISQQVGRTVINQTKLEGNYEVDLHWTPDLVQPDSSIEPPLAASSPQTSTASELSGPSIFTAIQEQLGLKLESTKGPVEILIVDYIERPSAN